MEMKIFESSDTNVKKFVFEWDENDTYGKGIAETVLYRYGEYKKRTVVCCSVMSGCPVGCTFCGTGRFFTRNLDADEIVQQVQSVLGTIDCKTDDIEKFQIMFMSMGEPMLNYPNTDKAINYLHKLYPNAQLLVSTSAPEYSTLSWLNAFILLSKQIDKVGLQFSVHESTDEARKKLIPTGTLTLRQIAAVGETWSAFVGRRPFFNYCVHPGNDTQGDADRLAKLFNPATWCVTLSVICQKEETVKSSIERQLELIKAFEQKMLAKGFDIRVFNPAGQDDIGGGCGQLWYYQQWLKRVKED